MSSDTSYETARGDMSVSVDAPSHTPDPDPITVSPVTNVARSRASSLFTDSQDSRSEVGILTDLPGYESPPPVDDLRAEMRDERRYRMLLQHEFHPSCTFGKVLNIWLLNGLLFFYSDASPMDPLSSSIGCSGISVQEPW